MDWGAGDYETAAEQLLPAALAVVDDAGVRRGERALDLGCGTGNATLITAQRGARVTAVDPVPRLLEVARRRAVSLEATIEFLVGEAAEIPVADASADLVLSVFGLIFAPDARAAAAEIARVTADHGRVVFSAWLPEGALAVVARERAVAIARAAGEGDRPSPFPWHDPAAVEELLHSHGFGGLEVHEHQLAFTAASPQAFAQAEFDSHPMWAAGRPTLDAAGTREEVEQRVTAIFKEANEDPHAFRVTSRYVVIIAARN